MVGDRIRDRRKKLNLQQRQLARDVGISQNYLSEIETGKRSASIDVLRNIAEKLNLRLSFLVDDYSTVTSQMAPDGAQDIFEEIRSLPLDKDSEQELLDYARYLAGRRRNKQIGNKDIPIAPSETEPVVVPREPRVLGGEPSESGKTPQRRRA